MPAMHSSNSLFSSLLVGFYRLWHGKLRLKGGGFLIRLMLPFSKGLNCYHLKLPEGNDVVVDFQDISAFYWLNHLLGDKFEEEGLLAAIANQTKMGDTVWDVGANCGVLSYRLAKESTAERIVFFEPNPPMFTLASAACSSFEKVSGFAWALSDHSRLASMTIPRGGSTTGTLESDRTGRKGHKAKVECKTGDDLIGTGVLPAPQIIKIDTEGHEGAVIKGLTRVIDTYKPSIFFEHISMTDDEVMQMIPEDYSLFSISDEDGSLKRGFDRSRGHNSVLIQKKPGC